MKKFILSILLTLLAASVTFGQETDKKVIYSENAPKVVGPYSQAILTGYTLYVSGNIGIVPETGLMDTLNFETEFRRVVSNLDAVLKEAGMSLSKVVKATVYMTDLKNYQLMNSLYAEYFKEMPPARETVQVVALPKGAHIEISCIAVK
jgi:2-iminobutanoate/2-iminopropanoate deaminase